MTDQKTLEINTYRYDPLDRITATAQGAKRVSQRFYNQKRLATDIQGTSTCSVFEAGKSLLAFHQADLNNRETRLLGTNLQRSVLEVIASNTTQTIAYTPYGSRSASEAVLSVLGFNGQRPDMQTGHYLLGNGVRAFNPVLMRFNSPDILSPFQEGGINAYVYCGGDPVNYEDPSGYMSWGLLRAALDVGKLVDDATPLLAQNRRVGHRLQGGMNRGVIAELRNRPAVRHPVVMPEYPNQSAAHRIEEVGARQAAERAQAQQALYALEGSAWREVRAQAQVQPTTSVAPDVQPGLVQASAGNQRSLNAATQLAGASGVNLGPSNPNRNLAVRWSVDTSYIRNIAVTRPPKSNYAGF